MFFDYFRTMVFYFLFLKDVSFRNIPACVTSYKTGYTKQWRLEQKLFKVEWILFPFFVLPKSSNTCLNIYIKLTLFLPPSQQIKNICSIHFLLFSWQSLSSVFCVHSVLPVGTTFNSTGELISGEEVQSTGRGSSQQQPFCLPLVKMKNTAQIVCSHYKGWNSVFVHFIKRIFKRNRQ